MLQLMYPLSVYLIGCTYEVLPDLRRELQNLSVVVEGEFVDARGCLEMLLAHPSATRLCIVHVKSVDDVAQLAMLNETAIGMPILALSDPTVDPTMMMRAMRAGAAQVVRLPLVAEDFHAAMNRIATQFGHPPSESRLITVLGANEGSGATTISLELAAAISRLRNVPCILGEGAVSFGRLARRLNIEPQQTIADLLLDMDHLDIERIRRALTTVEDSFRVLVGSYKAITPMQLNAEDVVKVIGYVKQLADVLIVDGRYVYDDLDFYIAAHSQQLILVANQSVASLHQLKATMELLAQHGGLAQHYVVINKFEAASQGFPLSKIKKIFNLPRMFTVAYDHNAIQSAENAGQTLRMAAPHSPALADIEALCRNIGNGRQMFEDGLVVA